MPEAATAEFVRDILISAYLAFGIIATLIVLILAFLLFRAVLGLIRSIRRTTDNISEMSEATKEHMVEPLREGMSFGSAVGNVTGFVTGFISGASGRSRKDRRRRGR